METLTYQHLTKKDMLMLSIPEPCHENWNEMLPTEKGAFCAACSKVVVDFTNLSDDEVKNYFIKNREERTCGRFKNHQLSSPEQLLSKLLTNSIPFWKKFLAIVVILFGSFLTGCEQATQGKVDAPEKAEVSRTFSATTGIISIESEDELQMGKPRLEEPVVSCTMSQGFAEPLIIPDTMAIDNETIGNIEEMPADSAMRTKPEKAKKDSVKKLEINKNSCDSLQTDKTIFYKR